MNKKSSLEAKEAQERNFSGLYGGFWTKSAFCKKKVTRFAQNLQNLCTF